MKGVAFGIILSLIPLSSMAADCFDMAGRDYKIDPDLLRAISWQESRFKIDAIGRNPVTGYGSGLMQIDSQHFNELSRYGIKPDHLLSDACLKEVAIKWSAAPDMTPQTVLYRRPVAQFSNFQPKIVS
ncbi:transglycosylase SLT domain-containing protein, partial [Klebsiella quasipneumoniae subsp. similipneumoniae]|uniref:transglycosylase SLT domain-containing protein n=1 Tax=Klebsiella quasipneumoniae TaxID=1463165 RepID=UPI0038CFDFFD